MTDLFTKAQRAEHCKIANALNEVMAGNNYSDGKLTIQLMMGVATYIATCLQYKAMLKGDEINISSEDVFEHILEAIADSRKASSPDTAPDVSWYLSKMFDVLNINIDMMKLLEEGISEDWKTEHSGEMANMARCALKGVRDIRIQAIQDGVEI